MPIRQRSRSYLNDPPSEPSDVPSGSILLNGFNTSGARDYSPGPPSSTSSEHSQESVATRTSQASVSFAPLPVIPPELKRRNSITLGVAARKNLLSSGPDNMYPNPGKKPDPSGIQKVYMNDADWEEYKRKHDEKNGLVTHPITGIRIEPRLMSSNDVPDLGDLVANGAKNLWRRVRSSPRSENLAASPTPSTSSINSAATNSSNNNSKIGSSPGAGNSLMSNLTSPRVAMRRRGGSDPSQIPTASNTMTKQPDLPDVEEEALSRMQSAEAPIQHSTSPGLSRQILSWHKNQTDQETAEGKHHPPSPPPRVEDVVPSMDEVNDSPGDGVQETIVEEMEMDDELEGGGALGLEKVDIRSEAGDVPEWKQEWKSTATNSNTRRDPDVLGFDTRRFGAGH